MPVHCDPLLFTCRQVMPIGSLTPAPGFCAPHTQPEGMQESATKTNGMTEPNILDGAYQQGVQNVYSDCIVATRIL